MSAGAALAGRAGLAVTNRLDLLAPRFRAAVEAALAECNRGAEPLEVVVFETWRSNALQQLYYQRGRTVRPPFEPVTNAWSNLFSWHGFGLAVDVVHVRKGWGAAPSWFRRVARVFSRHACRWGGEWKEPDLSHLQWGLCRASPSARARELLAREGIEAVWRAVGADLVAGAR